MSKTVVSSGLRGFSFMPESKLEVDNLQYVEGEELERTWKSSRRQRLKQREQKIWEEFVKEQDILNNVCKDDPYQFLEQLPESCLKELMEVELEKMRKEVKEATEKIIEDPKQEGDGDVSRQSYPTDELVTVTFCEDVETKDDEHCDMFHIFDDEKDDERGEEQSGAEEEAVNDSSSPSTVREKQSSPEPHSPPPPLPRSPDESDSNKSPENVSDMIESSIYCAKVKDLRPKINDEMLSIIESLEQFNITAIDPEELPKMCRRSTEFCSRFNRIYMYQLHRQIHDIKRNNGVTLPFARHTHFQSQMVRIVSLHQNLLQSLQVVSRSIQQTGCAGASAALLQAVTRATAAATAACRELTAPPALAAARRLYTDDMLETCDKLDQVVSEHAARMSAYVESNNTDSSRSKKSSSTGKKKKAQDNMSKNGSKKSTYNSQYAFILSY
ncbi:hypothetical protein evm_009471 [Chilo suppressalis]|nr:hypothetical protein evm_009471 [Chilo suppressalis]